MTVVPRGWEVASVGELCVEVRSGFASGKHNASGAGIPHLRPMNVSRSGKIDLQDLKFVDAGVDERRLSAGDVVFNNTNSPALVGKTALFTLPGEFGFSNHMTRLRVAPGVSAAFVATQLHYLWMTGGLSHLITNHVNQASISARVLAQRVELLVPPAPEQERIVAAIEEHLSRLEAAVRGVAAAGKRLAGLMAAVAVSAFACTDAPVAIGDVALVGSGATPARTNRRYWDEGTIPWVTSGAVNTVRITQPSALITPAALEETAVKFWPAGTVLVAMYGEGRTRGRAAELMFDSTCNQACAAIRTDPEVLRPAYLRWYLNSRYEQNRRLASGGVQPNLSLGLVKAMKVPVPPVPVQDEIVGRLELFAERIERFEAGAAVTVRRAATFRRSLLHAAFSGRLVPQDPEGEPAWVLLERIRAERAAAIPAKRPRKVKAS